MAVGGAPGSPAATIVMAAYNGAAFIEAALRSAVAQTLREIEIIVADDASTDDTAARVAAIAERDPRVRLLRSACNGGPAAARNRCLDVARGRWIAIMDSDDLMHPARLERMVAAAEWDGADIVADNLLIFHDDNGAAPAPCLRGGAVQAPFWVDPADYVRANAMFRGTQALGYLKPLLRADLAANLRYDPQLRIAEDYDFILRLLLGGARFRVYPEAMYFYRRHARSLSHRLSERTLEPMLRAHLRLEAVLAGRDSRLDAAMALRRSGIEQAIDFDRLLVALKRRDWAAALAQAWRQPRVAALLKGAAADRLRRGIRPIRVASRALKG